jgi:hypothetical protein
MRWEEANRSLWPNSEVHEESLPAVPALLFSRVQNKHNTTGVRLAIETQDRVGGQFRGYCLSSPLHSCLFVVILPRSAEDLLLSLPLLLWLHSVGIYFFLLPLQFFFFKNNPKIACQVPKPPNSLKQKKIEFEI